MEVNPQDESLTTLEPTVNKGAENAVNEGNFKPKKENEPVDNVSLLRAELRGSWEFIAACQFLVLFQEIFDLESFNTRDFEELLLNSCDRTTVQDDEELIIINVKLLNNLYRSRTVTTKNWLQVLPGQFEKRKKIEQEWIEYRSYIGIDQYLSSLDEIGLNMEWSEDLTYRDFSLRQKILIIYCLCEWQLDNADVFSELAHTSESDAAWIWVRYYNSRFRECINYDNIIIREPIGHDSTERFAYWHFHDHRLYKQSLQDSSDDAKSAETWTLVADSSSEWTEYRDSLKGSRNKNDKNLHSYISGVLDDVIPFLDDFEKERQKKKDLEEKMNNAKRSFRIRSRELEKLEIQSLDFLQDLSESRRSKRHRVKSPVLTKQERMEWQKKQQKESRSRRALERELKSVGLFDESIFATEQAPEHADSAGNQLDNTYDGILDSSTQSNSEEYGLNDKFLDHVYEKVMRQVGKNMNIISLKFLSKIEAMTGIRLNFDIVSDEAWPSIKQDGMILAVLEKCSLNLNNFASYLHRLTSLELLVLVPESCPNTTKLESLSAEYLLSTQRNLTMSNKTMIVIDDMYSRFLTKTYLGLNSSSAIIVDSIEFLTFNDEVYQFNWWHIAYTVVSLMIVALFIMCILINYYTYEYHQRINEDLFEDDDIEANSQVYTFSRNHTMQMPEIDLMFPTSVFESKKIGSKKNNTRYMEDTRSLAAKNSILSLYSVRSNATVVEPMTCSICLDTFDDGTTLRKLFCEHLFHKDCIDLWLTKGNAKCPLCNLEFYYSAV